MEIFLLCVAVAYMVAGKHQKDTATAAYKAGKEPPGLVKARMRHESGGGGRKPGSGKPQGPGAARLVLASRWANACEKVKDRADDKHRRWRAWHAEQAPTRDEQWRAKQARRIAKSERRAEKFASARGILAHPVATRQNAKQEQRAWDENAHRELENSDLVDTDPTEATDREDTPAGATPNIGPEPESIPDTSGQDVPNLDSAGSGGKTTQAGTAGGALVYQQAVEQLIAAADRVAEYRDDLASFADDLAGKGWGEQVTGPITDMDGRLSELEGTYRDLATQMQHQGDQGSEAYEQAPWVPGPHAVMA